MKIYCYTKKNANKPYIKNCFDYKNENQYNKIVNKCVKDMNNKKIIDYQVSVEYK